MCIDSVFRLYYVGLGDKAIHEHALTFTMYYMMYVFH